MTLSELPSLAALVAVAAITPGPNNVAVMAAAVRGGVFAAAPVIGGIVLGTQAMLLLVLWGVGRAFEAVPLLPALLAIGGCAYLCHLGVRMMFAPASQDLIAAAPDRRVNASLAGMFGLQFLNPKCWTLVLTAVAAAQAGTPSSLAAVCLILLFLIVPIVCLAVWSVLGSTLSAQLSRPRWRLMFDRTMGATLVASAAALLLDSMRLIEPLTQLYWSAP